MAATNPGSHALSSCREPIRQGNRWNRGGLRHSLQQGFTVIFFCDIPLQVNSLCRLHEFSDSCMVKMRIGVSGANFLISRAAAKPSIFGMLRSRITRSGFNCCVLLYGFFPISCFSNHH